jgi:anti-sigma factor ChrR (cupin superfamily)
MALPRRLETSRCGKPPARWTSVGLRVSDIPANRHRSVRTMNERCHRGVSPRRFDRFRPGAWMTRRSR